MEYVFVTKSLPIPTSRVNSKRLLEGFICEAELTEDLQRLRLLYQILLFLVRWFQFLNRQVPARLSRRHQVLVRIPKHAQDLVLFLDEVA